MIVFDAKNSTYTCPYCNKSQAWTNNCTMILNRKDVPMIVPASGYQDTLYAIYTIKCANATCNKTTIIAFNRSESSQVDILPQHVYRRFPEYIPEQIRTDYEEASQIIDLSPKAAATLLRRCLQGMIRDFWGITRNRLYDEINELNGRVTPSQWNAIDGLRKLGNIGAHMESDVNLIIDLSPDEAKQLLKLIELLLEKWYVARHDEEELLNSIVSTSDQKQGERNPTP